MTPMLRVSGRPAATVRLMPQKSGTVPHLIRSVGQISYAAPLSSRVSTATGGTICGMKTTLYLPDDLKGALETEARRRGVSEAEVVRESLRQSLMSRPTRPRGGLINGREPIADRVDELLAEGFGS